MNVNGWSNWSPVGYIKAASVPIAPLAPTLVSTTATTITLNINPSLSDGGSQILAYKLFMDSGVLGSAFTLISNYDGTSATYTVTTSDGLVQGTKFRFITVASNAIGDSEASPEVRFAAASVPTQPAQLRRGASSTLT